MIGSQSSSGTIITFYSYKGGTGRSMILANVAWILASAGKRVLTIDWDLEAPGLHRFFSPFLLDRNLAASEGVIDFVFDYTMKAMSPPGHENDKEWYEAQADISRYAVSLVWPFPSGGTLDFVPAGKQDDVYSKKVSSFNWQDFYERFGGGRFLDLAKRKMQADYDYVLIDSRTGVSDSSGICTVQMPDKVVICYSLNNQSMEGAASVARSILAQRSKIETKLFPVPMRIDTFEKGKLDLRKDLAKSKFEGLLSHMKPSDREKFIAEVQFPYIPYYAYEEILAVFGDEPGQRGTLLDSTERLVHYLIDDELQPFEYPTPQQRKKARKDFAEPESSESRNLAPIQIDRPLPGRRWSSAYRWGAIAYKKWAPRISLSLRKWGPPISLAASIIIYTAAIVTNFFTDSTKFLTGTPMSLVAILIFGVLQVIYTWRLHRYLISKKVHYASVTALSVISVALFLVWLGYAGVKIIPRNSDVGESELALRNINPEVNTIRARYNAVPPVPDLLPPAEKIKAIKDARDVALDAATIAAKIAAIPNQNLGLGLQVYKYESLAYTYGIVAGSEIIAGKEFTQEEKQKPIKALFDASKMTRDLIAEVRRPQLADSKLQNLRAWLIDDDADPRLERLTAVGYCLQWKINKDPKDRAEAQNIVNKLPINYIAREHPEKTYELQDCAKSH